MELDLQKRQICKTCCAPLDMGDVKKKLSYSNKI